MSQGYKRRPFIPNGRHQWQIIILVALPSMLLCAVITAFILFFHNELIKLIVYSTKPPSAKIINAWSVYMLSVLWALYAVVMLVVLRLSSNLVGAFDRIIRELDEIILNREKRRLRARPQDDLANELLIRINTIIDRLPDSYNKKINTKEGRF